MDDSRLIVPALDEVPWPTLGPEVEDFIVDNLCHGPGDLLGNPIEAGLTNEERLFLYRAYEVYPRLEDWGEYRELHALVDEAEQLTGRRRFKRAVYSRRKGARKTELAAWVAIAEMDPNGPVRCDGWRLERGAWVPSGRPVRDPFIPMVAYTEEQVEDLAYAAAFEILRRCDLASDYDAMLEEIRHRHSPGKIAPYAAAPSGRDGARTTFQHFDETHLFILEKLRRAHRVMMRNIPKRALADAWAMETTTMFGPGEGSVAELAYEYALAVLEGRLTDSTLYFDHRQASEDHEIGAPGDIDDEEAMAALVEASGDVTWSDLRAARNEMHDPNADEAEWRRYWLNQPRKPTKKWLSKMLWAALAHEVLAWKARDAQAGWPPEGTRVVLGFDGSYNRDSTALVGATVAAKPHVFVVKAWEKNPGRTGWRTPRGEVDREINAALQRWQVLELAPDPPGWHREIEEWEVGPFGSIVVRFETRMPSRMGPACDDMEQAAKDREFTHDGNPALARHVGNCTTEERAGHVVVTKPDSNSPDKIDLAVGAIVAHHRARWHHANTPEPWAVAT